MQFSVSIQLKSVNQASRAGENSDYFVACILEFNVFKDTV